MTHVPFFTTSPGVSCLAAAGGACLLVIAAGPLVIGWLRRCVPERIDSASERLNALHASKQNTPTMGGLLILGGMLIAAVGVGEVQHRESLVTILAAVSFGLLGAVDDGVKTFTGRLGLTPRRKLLAQLALGSLLAVLLDRVTVDPDSLSRSVGEAAWCVFVIVAFSNAVNLTDGLDGLAAGTVCFAAFGLILVALGTSAAVSAGMEAVAVLVAAQAGAMLGFLWHNRHPARLFMGDCGSLSAGATLAVAALIWRLEWTLALAGGVFVLETLSVVAQVASFRTTGNRLLACSPLHNHFLFRGMREGRIVAGFWLIAAGCAAAAWAAGGGTRSVP